MMVTEENEKLSMIYKSDFLALLFPIYDRSCLHMLSYHGLPWLDIHHFHTVVLIVLTMPEMKSWFWGFHCFKLGSQWNKIAIICSFHFLLYLWFGFFTFCPLLSFSTLPPQPNYSTCLLSTSLSYLNLETYFCAWILI